MMQYSYQSPREISRSSSQAPVLLRPEQIKLPKAKQRIDASPNAIIRLAESIKKYGILEPLSVLRCGEEQGTLLFELIEGERRLRAASLAGLDRIPCVILAKDSKTCAAAGIFDSIRAGRLHMFEQAAAFRMLMEEFSLTQEEIARKLGVSQSSVANKLRLLKLSRQEQERILETELTERHARAILRLKTAEQRDRMLQAIHTHRLNVADTERWVEEALSHAQAPIPPAGRPVSVVVSPEKPPSGICPKKFAIPNLTPLYNSIERTLSIFRKTGATATCLREEGERSVRIIIEIPRNA